MRAGGRNNGHGLHDFFLVCRIDEGVMNVSDTVLHRGAVNRFTVVLVTVLCALVAGSSMQSAEAATGRLLRPNEVFPIAAGLVDAAGTLGLQCGMANLGRTLRGGTPVTRVASQAVKSSLAFAGAKKGCTAAVETLKAVAVMVGLAELNRPAWVSLEQSRKKKFLRPDTCTAVIRTGPSQSLAATFTASFTC